jgi:hypothetical protein
MLTNALGDLSNGFSVQLQTTPQPDQTAPQYNHTYPSQQGVEVAEERDRGERKEYVFVRRRASPRASLSRTRSLRTTSIVRDTKY